MNIFSNIIIIWMQQLITFVTWQAFKPSLMLRPKASLEPHLENHTGDKTWSCLLCLLRNWTYFNRIHGVNVKNFFPYINVKDDIPDRCIDRKFFEYFLIFDIKTGAHSSKAPFRDPTTMPRNHQNFKMSYIKYIW